MTYIFLPPNRLSLTCKNFHSAFVWKNIEHIDFLWECDDVSARQFLLTKSQYFHKVKAFSCSFYCPTNELELPLAMDLFRTVAPNLTTVYLNLIDEEYPDSSLLVESMLPARNLTSLTLRDEGSPIRIADLLHLDLSGLQHLNITTFLSAAESIPSVTRSLKTLKLTEPSSFDEEPAYALQGLPKLLKDTQRANPHLGSVHITPDEGYVTHRSAISWISETLLILLPELLRPAVDLNQHCIDQLGIPLAALVFEKASVWQLYVLTFSSRSFHMKRCEELFEACHGGVEGLKSLKKTLEELPSPNHSSRSASPVNRKCLPTDCIRPFFDWALSKMRKYLESSDELFLSIVPALVVLGDRAAEHDFNDLRDAIIPDVSRLIKRHLILRDDISLSRSSGVLNRIYK
jgi:hypothetical protein